MRIFTISDGTGMQALRDGLIDRRISATRVDAAIARLRALNPHVDLDRAGPGTVIFVPDGPEFTARATASPTQGAADELRSETEVALAGAAEQLKAGLAKRAAERQAVRAAFDNAVFRRAIANDQDLQRRTEEAARSMDAAEAEESRAAETLDATGQAALDALSALGKLAG